MISKLEGSLSLPRDLHAGGVPANEPFCRQVKYPILTFVCVNPGRHSNKSLSPSFTECKQGRPLNVHLACSIRGTRHVFTGPVELKEQIFDMKLCPFQ